MSLGKILNTAKQAIFVSQASVRVAGHNISNASTPGYTRQGVIQSAVAYRDGYLVEGVYVSGTSYPRSTLLDTNFRRESSIKAEMEFRQGVLGQVESVMGEMTDAAISKSIDAFWSAWSDLASVPSGSAQREMVRTQAESLVSQFNSMASRLDDVTRLTADALKSDVDSINQFTREIADLNRLIAGAESGGATAADLRDARNRVLDQLSELVSIQVHENRDGSVSVVAGGGLLVDNRVQQDLSLNLTAGVYSVRVGSSTAALPVTGGKVSSGLDLLNTRVPGVRASLDEVVETFVTEVNALHQTGTNAAAVTGVDFFDPAGTTMASIQVSVAVRADLENVMSGTSGAAGDNSVALAISQLRTQPQAALGNRAITDAWQDVSVDLAFQIDRAMKQASAQDVLVTQIANERSSLSEVSIEEEMISMQRAQDAYMAATRIISVVNEMYEDLLRAVD